MVHGRSKVAAGPVTTRDIRFGTPPPPSPKTTIDSSERRLSPSSEHLPRTYTTWKPPVAKILVVRSKGCDVGGATLLTTPVGRGSMAG